MPSQKIGVHLCESYFLKISSFNDAEVAQLAVDFRFEVRKAENQGPEAFRDRALNAEVAQLVEQLICNQQVAGSTPVFGSGI